MSSQLPLCCLLLLLAGTWAQETLESTSTDVPISTTNSNPTAQSSQAPPATVPAPSSTATAPAPSSTASAPIDHSLQWVILRAENPSGFVQDGSTPCTDFAFAGVQCSLTFDYNIKTSLIADVIEPHTDTFSYGNSGDNTLIRNTSIAGEVFEGFEITGTLKGNGKEIATFKYSVSPDQPKGIFTLTDPATGASVKFAWKSGLKPPVTTIAPTTQQSTTPAEWSTASEATSLTESPGSTTEAPFFPEDCDAYTGTARTNEVKTIYIKGDPGNNISVYCEYGSSGALTTIQSRGKEDQTNFTDTFADYKKSFGIAGKGNNFWFGLDNMQNITANAEYNLFVEVCCGPASTQQRYHNFTIGDSASNYTLKATPDTPGVGLDLKATGQTYATDIGAQFATRTSYAHDPDLCEALTTYDLEYTKIISEGYGGWWFGSCANNLNGRYIDAEAEDHGTCKITSMTNSTGTGVALRTTSGYFNEGAQTYLDQKSYTRVRMAIFKNSVPLQGISLTDFCGNTK